jgi:hypothetical protein
MWICLDLHTTLEEPFTRHMPPVGVAVIMMGKGQCQQDAEHRMNDW